MLTTILVFILLLAMMEAAITWAIPLSWLAKRWVQIAIHFGVFALNLAVHWGTVTGTMAATGAFCVSIVVIPAVIWLKNNLPTVRGWWAAVVA